MTPSSAPPVVLAAAAVLVLLARPSRLPAARAAGGRASSRRARVPWSGAAAVPLVAVLLGGPVLGALAAVGVVVVVRARRARAVAREQERERETAVEALSALVAELRAGRSAAAALSAAAGVATGPFGAALTAAAAGGDLGADPAPYLVREAERSAVPDVLRGVAVCWAVCASSGAALAPTLERLEEAVRAQRAQQQAVAAELAGPRATAALLAALPAAGLLLAAALGADPLHVLLHTPLGGGCLVAGVLLDLVGLWWTGRIVAAAES